MSDTGRDARNFPDLTLPSPEETVEAAPARGRRLSGGLIRAGLFTALVLSLIFAGRCALSGSEAGRMKVSGLSPGESDLKGVSAETSPEYKRRLDDYSARRGSEAIEKGGTFVAPASGVGKPVPAEPFEAPRVTREPPAPAPAPPAAKREDVPVFTPVSPQPRVRTRPAERRERGDQTVISYLAGLRSDPGQPAAMVLNRPSPRTDTSRHAVTPAAPPAGVPGVLPGDILYAVNRVTLDSDAPGPAMVEVIMGPFRGARAIGSFQRLGEHLVLRFSSFVLTAAAMPCRRTPSIPPQTEPRFRAASTGIFWPAGAALWPRPSWRASETRWPAPASPRRAPFTGARSATRATTSGISCGSAAPAWADAPRAFWSRISGCRPLSSSNQAPKWGCCSLKSGNDPAQGRDGAGLRRK